MLTAINKARNTISQFDKALQNPSSSYSEFAVKKKYKTNNNGGGEHMWVAIISFDDKSYKGYINNTAEKTTEVKYGDTVIIKKGEITDWMYLDGNVLRGGYTIREIRDRASKEERIAIDKELGFIIKD